MARRGQLVVLTALTVVVVTAFARLGLWQLDRAAWKAEWLVQWQAAEQAPPRAINGADLADRAVDAAMVQHVAIAGRWDEQPLVLLDNRIRDGRVGFGFYRILRSPDLPVALLVDLGWQAWSADRQLPAADALLAASRLPDGTVLSGLLLPWPGQGLAVGSAGSMDADGRLLLSRLDREVIRREWLRDDSRQAALANAVLKLDPELTIGFARDREALPNTLPPERHRGYAVQWFALATAVVLIYGVLLWRSIRHHRQRRETAP